MYTNTFENVIEAVEKALIIISSNTEKLLKLNLLVNFPKIYPFATENIKGYLKTLAVYIEEDKNGQKKKGLTVGGSGDQLLNLVFLGITEIDYFDICPFTEFYVELKIAAIKALDYDEFIEFFSLMGVQKLNKNVFNIKSYKKISFYLNEKIKLFWDLLYLNFTGLEIRESGIFMDDEPRQNVLQEINLYLNRENYYTLKEKLLKMEYKAKFYQANLFDLPQNLSKTYYTILLSNIAVYDEYFPNSEIIGDYNEYYLKEFKQTILQLSKHVKKGIIYIAYLYNNDKQTIIENDFPIYNTLDRNRIFNENEYEYIEIDGMRKIKNIEEVSDMVLIKKLELFGN